MKIIAFCVLNEGYVDPAIVALRSFCRWNSTIEVICYAEKGANYANLQQALDGYLVSYKEVPFPKEDIFNKAGGKYLLIPNSAMPAISQRLICLDELKKNYDLIINFDLDTLFCNSIKNALNNADSNHIYGVDEKENRNKWITNFCLKEWIPGNKYFNTGFVIYGAKVLRNFSLYESYLKALNKNPEHFNCPEQDFLNYLLNDYLILLKPNYNLMFTDKLYFSVAPVMIHFYGSLKPWNSQGRYLGNVGFYYDKYKKIAQQYQRWLSPEFIKQLISD